MDEQRRDELMALHIAWRGGSERLGRLHQLERRGTMQAHGLTGSIALTVAADLGVRVDVDLGVVSLTECGATRRPWLINTSGQVEPMGDKQAASSRRTLSRELVRFPATCVHLGTEERDGRTWDVLRLPDDGGEHHDLLIDPADGSTTWAREVRDTDTVWVRSADWRAVDGVRLPFRQEEHHHNSAHDQTIDWDHTSVDTDVDAALFVAPTPEGPVRFEAAWTAWLPLTFQAERHHTLQGTVDGHPTPMLLDSGAGITVLSARFAEQIGLQSTGTFVAQGIGGDQQITIAAGLEIRIGDLTLSPITAAITDLSEIEEKIGCPIPVIIGKELFHGTVVDVDYPGRRIRFGDPASFAYDGPGRTVLVEAAESGHSQVRCGAEAAAEEAFTVDTGAGDAVTLFEHYTTAHDLLDRAPLSERRATGAGGSTLNPVGTLRSFTFCGFELLDVPATFQQEQKGGFHTRRNAGNLGMGIFERFRMVFDYSRSQLHLEPAPDWQTRPFRRDRSGIQTIHKGDHLEVFHVASGSPAHDDGFRVGDRITAIDGRAIGADYWDEPWRWPFGPPGSTVELTDGEGTRHSLGLRDYR